MPIPTTGQVVLYGYTDMSPLASKENVMIGPTTDQVPINFIRLANILIGPQTVVTISTPFMIIKNDSVKLLSKQITHAPGATIAVKPVVVEGFGTMSENMIVWIIIALLVLIIMLMC